MVLMNFLVGGAAHLACWNAKVVRVVNGMNCTVIAFGATSSGKTHTFEGAQNVNGDAGIIAPAITALFGVSPFPIHRMLNPEKFDSVYVHILSNNINSNVPNL